MKIDEFVIYHLKLIDITKKLNSIYKSFIFVTYIIGVLIYVPLGLCIITTDNFLNNFSIIMHGVSALFYVAIFSYGSQKIMDSSEALCDEVYNIDKDYLMVIMIAQKKLSFRTPFFEASFDTFSFMLSRSWSFITVLSSFV